MAPSCEDAGTSAAATPALASSTAHCVAPAGVASVEQCSSSIGWPLMPPRYSFAYSTVASTVCTRSESEPKAAASPSVTKPILIGSPVAGFGSPSPPSAGASVAAVVSAGASVLVAASVPSVHRLLPWCRPVNRSLPWSAGASSLPWCRQRRLIRLSRCCTRQPRSGPGWRGWQAQPSGLWCEYAQFPLRRACARQISRCR